MSRSYKKHPITKSHDYITTKQMANQKVRRAEDEDLPTRKRSSFKKITNSWDLNDYISRWTEEDARVYYRMLCKQVKDGTYRYLRYAKEILEKYPTEDDYIKKYWAKHNKRK